MADEPQNGGESDIPGFLENIGQAVQQEGGPQESSPPRRSAEEEILHDEVGKPASPDSVPQEEPAPEQQEQPQEPAKK
jgi:hypothetical protein